MNTQTSGVQVLIGSKGIKEVYERALHERQSVDFICMSAGYEQVLGGWYDDQYAPKLFASSIQTRELLPDTQDNRSYKGKKDLNKNQVWFLKGKRTESDLILGENWVALVSFDVTQPMALVIEEPEIVASLKNQFDQLWMMAQANT